MPCCWLELSTAYPPTDCLSQPPILPTSAPHSLRAIVATATHHFCNRPTSCHRINLFMVYLTAISGPVLQLPSHCSQGLYRFLSGCPLETAIVTADVICLHLLTSIQLHVRPTYCVKLYQLWNICINERELTPCSKVHPRN